MQRPSCGREGSCAGSTPTTTLTLSRSVPALRTVLVLTGVSTYFFLRLKIQPMHRPQVA